MPFTPIELEQIETMVGKFCRNRVPDNVKDRIRLDYTVSNHDVVITETRPGWRDGPDLTLEIAKLRYVRSRNEWRLYWKRASGKWLRYVSFKPSTKLKSLIRDIDEDSDGCFFG